MKVILITGASSGMGHEAARMLSERGHKVYAAARRTDRMESLKQYDIVPLCVDVTSDESAEKAVDAVIAAEGRIDVLINNAGYGSFGPMECVPMEEAHRQLEVNVVGVARMTRLVLPYMRAQKSGRIVNVASVAGRTPIYFGGWYNASKYALEAISDATRMETSRFGIDVSIIEPGAVFSDWGRIAAENLKKTSEGSDYRKYTDKMANVFGFLYEKNPMGMMTTCNKAAKMICKASTVKRPKARYTFGLGSGMLLTMHAILPARWFDKLQISVFENEFVNRMITNSK